MTPSPRAFVSRWHALAAQKRKTIPHWTEDQALNAAWLEILRTSKEPDDPVFIRTLVEYAGVLGAGASATIHAKAEYWSRRIIDEGALV